MATANEVPAEATFVASTPHPAAEAVAAISAELDYLATADLSSIDVEDLTELLANLETVSRRIDAAQVAFAAQADASLVAEREGATSLGAWLKAVADVPISVTRRRLRLHQELRSRPVTAASFGAGDITMEAASAICEALRSLPTAVPPAVMNELEGQLVDIARAAGTRAAMHQALEIVHRFAPSHMEQEEERQAGKNWLRLSAQRDGTVALRGLLDKEAGALAFGVLGPLAAPAPATDGVADARDADTRYGEAFVQALHLASGQPASDGAAGTRGGRAHLLVTISLEALLDKLGAAPGRLLDTATPISATAARRLACDAKIIPVVLGASSEPLDIGRASNVVPTGLRRAIVVRDQGCAMPGCERPPGWCDVHHNMYWSHGGDTSIDNCCLLCERHHTIVHTHGWRIEIRDGLPWFIPPAWLDATQAPRLHERYRLRPPPS
jgi:hypothetical protein